MDNFNNATEKTFISFLGAILFSSITLPKERNELSLEDWNIQSPFFKKFQSKIKNLQKPYSDLKKERSKLYWQMASNKMSNTNEVSELKTEEQGK